MRPLLGRKEQYQTHQHTIVKDGKHILGMCPSLDETPEFLTVFWSITIARGRANKQPQVHLLKSRILQALPVIQDRQFALPSTAIAKGVRPLCWARMVDQVHHCP